MDTFAVGGICPGVAGERGKRGERRFKNVSGAGGAGDELRWGVGTGGVGGVGEETELERSFCIRKRRWKSVRPRLS